MAAEDYRNKVATLAEEPDAREAPPAVEVHQGFYFFLSMDLVGSTEFKVAQPNQWLGIFAEFYEIAGNTVRKFAPSLQLWKFAGDEVLFYGQLEHGIDTLVTIVDDCYRALEETLDALCATRAKFWHKGALSPEHAQDKRLSIKATAWIAAVMDTLAGDGELSSAEGPRNRVVATSFEGQQGIDFLGPEVDAGFRLGKLTWAGILLVSAEIAYLLWKYGPGPSSNRLRIVGYEQLKGVWANRYYPAVWYVSDWDNVGKMFAYDGAFVSPQVAIATSKPEKIDQLEKIFADADKVKIAQQLKLLLESPQGQPLSKLHQSRLEVHVVAVCVDTEGRVLVARRSRSKSILPGFWEFGCGRLTIDDDFESCVRREYAGDFGVKVEALLNPPIGSYVIGPPDKPARVPGVLFAARASGEPVARPEKHDELKWMTLQELEAEVPADRAVADLHQLAKRAIAAAAPQAPT